MQIMWFSTADEIKNGAHLGLYQVTGTRDVTTNGHAFVHTLDGVKTAYNLYCPGYFAPGSSGTVPFSVLYGALT
jgi:hypothetical protein